MTKPTWDLRRYGCLLAVGMVGVLTVSACTTTKRVSQLVIDHHVGMVRGAVDVVTGKAEERAERIAKLRADLEASRAALAAEEDPARVLDLLKAHVQIQDALLAELLHGHRGMGHHHTSAADAVDGEAGRHDHQE